MLKTICVFSHVTCNNKRQRNELFSLAGALQPGLHTTSCAVLSAVLRTGSCKRCLPDLWVAVTQDMRQQLRRLLEAATQLIQLLLHGEDALLQLPVGIVPIGTEVAHDHLHLLESQCRTVFQCALCKNWPHVKFILPTNRGSISPGRLRSAANCIIFIHR